MSGLSETRNRDPKIRTLAIVLICASLLWSLIFASYFYVGLIIAGVAVVWFFSVLKRRQDELEQNFRNRFANADVQRVDKHVVFKAQRSHGYSQAQGMGYLVLTDAELYFEMSLLDKVISIPLTSVSKVGQAKRMLGVGTIRPMLTVEFTNAKGEADAIALFVKELSDWKNAITTAAAEAR